MNPRILLVPALLGSLACGSGKLTPALAEKLIRPDYPVLVTIRVPKSATAEKGSAEAQKIQTINGLLAKTGAFRIEGREEGAKVHYAYAPSPGVSGITTTDKNYLLPAAEASFVKVLRAEARGDRTRVTYQIRLARPTPHFGLYQFLHPATRIGDTHERHAVIEKQGNNWGLMETDETFKSKE